MKSPSRFEVARRLHKGEAQCGHVPHSLTRQQGDGAGTGEEFSGERDHGLVQASACFWQTGFCLPEAGLGGLCRWMLLAWVSAARDKAPDQCGVLEEEVRGKQGARPAREPDPTKSRLEGRPDLGA